MAKYNRNSGKRWTSGEVTKLRELAKGNTPTGVMSIKLGRTPEAISSKAFKEGISLKPVNKPPYNRRKNSK